MKRNFKNLMNIPLNEANPVEFAASEYRCATLILDKMGVSNKEKGKTLSLVGRILRIKNNC